MSLLKLPLLASVAWGIHTTMTAPNPPPTDEERLPPTGLEHLATAVPPLPKVGGHQAGQIFFWTASLAEMVVITANRFPTYSLSRRALRILVRASPQAGKNLYITLPFLIGWSLAVSGSILRRYCYHTLGRQFTFELSIRRDHRLVKGGAYAYVRHPSYTGALLAGAGGLLCVLGPGSWVTECLGLWDGWSAGFVLGVLTVGAAVAVRAVSGRMGREDAMMCARFGGEWEQWAREVPWKLIPCIY